MSLMRVNTQKVRIDGLKGLIVFIISKTLPVT